MSDDYRRWTKEEAERVKTHAQMLIDQQRDIHTLCAMWPDLGSHMASLNIITAARQILTAADNCLWELRLEAEEKRSVAHVV